MEIIGEIDGWQYGLKHDGLDGFAIFWTYHGYYEYYNGCGWTVVRDRTDLIRPCCKTREEARRVLQELGIPLD